MKLIKINPLNRGFFNRMAKNKKQPTEADRLRAGVYKGYSINWLRKETGHPDYGLVAEYDALKKEK